MECEIYDYPTRGLVCSESETGSAYLVNLCDYKIGTKFNGSCTCPHFKLQLERKLKQPDNDKFYRCKHIRHYRENCLDYCLPVMCAADPNILDDQQV